jgi:hypothetical protein
MWSRRIELVCGALCGALGLALLGVWLFAPLGMKLISTGDGPGNPARYVPASFWQLYGLASLLFPITVVGGLSLGIVLFALWHSRARRLPALILLWVCTALLWLAWVATLMALPSIGVLTALHGGGVLFVLLVLVPVVALVASIAGTVAARQRVPAHV